MRSLLIAALAATIAVPATAQDGAAKAEQEVTAVVTRMFDAMRARDTATLRAIFDPGVRLVGTTNRSGTPTVEMLPIGDFIGMIATAAPGQLLDERLMNTKVQVSDNLAAVWTDYRFYVGERFSHCGVDAFILARGPGGWKIVALGDTRKPPTEC